KGAVASYAETLYMTFTADEQQQMQHLFVQLVHPGVGTEDFRRLAMRSELADVDWRLVQKIADGRLVVTRSDASEREYVEIVHEALIGGWWRLKSWMEEDRRFRTWQERL